MENYTSRANFHQLGTSAFEDSNNGFQEPEEDFSKDGSNEETLEYYWKNSIFNSNYFENMHKNPAGLSVEVDSCPHAVPNLAQLLDPPFLDPPLLDPPLLDPPLSDPLLLDPPLLDPPPLDPPLLDSPLLETIKAVKDSDSVWYDHQNYLVESMTGLFLSDGESDNENEEKVKEKSKIEDGIEGSQFQNFELENEFMGEENKNSEYENFENEQRELPLMPEWQHSVHSVNLNPAFPFQRRRSMPNTSELYQKFEKKPEMTVSVFQRPSSGSVSSSDRRVCRRGSLPEYFDVVKVKMPSVSFRAAVNAEMFRGHPVMGVCETKVGTMNMTVYSQDISQLESFSRQHSANNSCESLPLIEPPAETPAKYDWGERQLPAEVSVGPVKRYIGIPCLVPLMPSINSPAPPQDYNSTSGTEITGAWNPSAPNYPEVKRGGFLKKRMAKDSQITGAWNPIPPKYPEIDCEPFLRRHLTENSEKLPF